MTGVEATHVRLARARAALTAVESRVGSGREGWDSPTLPLATSLSEVLPGGLRRGQVVSVEGSTSLMLALAARASAEGSWTVAIGMPSLGIVAAARRGIELHRLALVPHPGVNVAAVAGACVDGMDVVLCGPGLALSDADRRRLVARARERGSVIVAAGSWAGAHARLVVEASRWEGLGAGDGRLRSRTLTVAIRAREGSPVSRVVLTLDQQRSLPRVRPSGSGQARTERAGLEGAA